MANVLPPLSSHHSPSAARSPLQYSCQTAGPSAGRQTSSISSAPFYQLTSNLPNIGRPAKRRLEVEDSENSYNGRESSMDRSPTPERPKRAPPKRLRASPSGDTIMKLESSRKASDDDVDVGVLLAALPQESLLPLLNALVSSQPSLKPLVLALIPRPSIEAATQAIASASRHLTDAYPYSGSPQGGSSSAPHSGQSPVLGFGFAKSLSHGSFGFANQYSADGGMRASYVESRIRPHVANFVSTVMSYLPYFSCLESARRLDGAPGSAHLQRDPPLPDTFMFLSKLTNEILSQPHKTQEMIHQALSSRLFQEWMAWVDRLDERVNQLGGMFGVDQVTAWIRDLDMFSETQVQPWRELMVKVRERWIGKVGWLVGKREQYLMEEL